MDALVEYDYNAQNEDELSIKKGDKIKNALKKEEGWMEGELNGKKGLFPDNFVKVRLFSLQSVSKNNFLQIVKKTNTANQNEKRKNFFSDLSNKFINNDKKNLPNHINQQQQQPGRISPILATTSPKPPVKPSKCKS